MTDSFVGGEDVLTVPRPQHIILPLPRHGKGPPHHALALLNQTARLLLYDRKPLIHMAEPGVREFVSPGDVRLRVAVRLLEVGLHGFAVFGVDAVGDLEGLLAIGVVLEGVDGIGDDGVARQVGEEFGVGLGGAVGHGGGGVFGRVRHGVLCCV